jgi:hypothetical protein
MSLTSVNLEPEQGDAADYTKGGDGTWKDVPDAEFRAAFCKCMDGDGASKQRANFTELVVRFSEACSLRHEAPDPRYPLRGVLVLATSSTTRGNGARQFIHRIVHRCSPRHPLHVPLV